MDFDLAVIGGGSGGYAAARTAHAAGLRVAVIEGGAEVGGLCILRGCMPTKALLYAAEVRHLAQASAIWGMKAGEVPFNWEAVMARKEAMVQDFASYRTQQLTDGRFHFIRAMARFTDPHQLALSTGETVTARAYVISTGSVPSDPPLARLAEVGYLTSDDALTLKKLPRSMIILGGGAVAVEFAQFFARFDVKVTVIQRGPRLVKDFDPDAATVLESVLRREDVSLYTGTQLVDAYQKGGGKVVTFLHGGAKMQVEADEILFALGRSPNTRELGLDQAGVTLNNDQVVTNSRMQTSVPHIYAVGDCTSAHEIVHIAIQQGEIAAHNIAHPERPRTIDYRLLTSVVFTDPALAAVGLTELTASERGVACRVARHPFEDHGKSLIMDAKDGFVKLLADPESGEILGGCCVGPLGGELIHQIVAAMHKRMTVHELAAMPHYHPTLSEIWTYPAEELAERISI